MVVTCYRGSEKVEKYSWNPEKRISSALLKKSGFDRLEIWVPFGTQDEMVKLGWKVARRSDQSEIVSDKGNVLLTFPERVLKPFPF